MFKRNTTNLFIASAIFVLACIVYSYIFINSSRNEVRALNLWVEHSRQIISQTSTTIALQEAMLADQRGFLLTGDINLLASFETNQRKLLRSSYRLMELTEDNPAQHAQAAEIKEFATQYVHYLNKRKDDFKNMVNNGDNSSRDDFVLGLDTVTALHEKLTSLLDGFRLDENSILKERLAEANVKRAATSRNIVISLFGSCALIMLINWVLFQQQKRHFLDSERLRNIDDRHKVAIKAANDGIFDWDIDNKNIFFSSQIFRMCGYDKEDYDGSLFGLIVYMGGTNPLDLIHPDDLAGFKQNLDNFANGLTSEYTNTFRAKHTNGYWIWIYARGGGIFDERGKPIRLIGSHSDITAQKQIEERLKKEMEEAENSSKAKMEFLAHMSHEIRTPLTTVTGIAEILSRQANSLNEKQNSLVKTLVTSSTTLKDLINDVLDFSRIDSGEITLEKTPIHLDTILSDVISIMSVQAIEKNLQFKSIHQDIAQMVFEGDQTRLRQILINLVGNAIKFTEKGSVTIEADLHGFNPDASTAILSLKVTDTGMGIPAQYHELIFDKFKQVDDTISKNHGGTGLGLPISKSLAEMMNGSLRVESELGKGSVFTLEIPVNILNIKDLLMNNDGEEATCNLRMQLSHAAAIEPQSYKVLIVEDYEGNIVVISYILDEMGIEYDVARNGEEALERMSECVYKVILMDLQMPKMDGLTATLKIRAMEKLQQRSKTPIIGMTAHATLKDKNNCLESGMDAFISKPIDQARLIETLAKYLA